MQTDTNKFKAWVKYSKINWYYYSCLRNFTRNLIPEDASVLEFGCKKGELLKTLPNKNKVGVEFDRSFVGNNKSLPKIVNFNELGKHLKNKKFDYIILSNTLSEIENIQDFLKLINRYSHDRTRVVVVYFNYLWKPFLDFGERLGLKSPDSRPPNWLAKEDIDNFFSLQNYQLIKNAKYFLVPFKIPYFSDLINKYISPLPLIQELCLLNYSIFKVSPKVKDYSVSLIIPARNEAGNMVGVIKQIPKLNTKQEVIFVEGHSTDDTFDVIKNEIKKYKGEYKVSLFKQRGKGKGDAVRMGFSKAKNELLIILDADLTVSPKELPKFYDSIRNGKAEMVMGSRLIYPMENQAMRTLNILGNKFFSSLFSFLLDQKIKDTLCGTKVLLKSDYEKIVRNRKIFGDFDPFGDFDLIFGAAKLNLKISEIPIRYKERTYGTTNISRFTHGWLLLKMAIFAAKKFKFI